MSQWKHQTDVQVEQNLSSGELVTWAIRGERLPEAFLRDVGAGRREFVALLYKIDAEVAENGFSLWNTEWPETVDLPCRFLSLAVLADEDSGCQLIPDGMTVALFGSSSQLPEETMKYSREALLNHGKVAISYPLQGATYSLQWKMLGTDASNHGTMVREPRIMRERQFPERAAVTRPGRSWTPR